MTAPADPPSAAPSRGFALSRERFGDRIDFFAPGLKRYSTSEFAPKNPRAFLPVSVTGSACALQCDHCSAKVLEGMISVTPDRSLFDTAAELHAAGTKGMLVSGGSQRTGRVPLLRHVPDIQRIKAELGMRVICHVGYPDRATADALAAAGVDGAMIDVIGSDDTLKDVYHLPLTVADVERSIASLADAGLRIIPHIVLGLHYGKFLGEHDALAIIGRYPVWTLILVVLTPLVGTPMGHLPPPDTGEVVAFFHTAREAMNQTRVHLGCARPLGDVKVCLDRAAVDAGFNGIAYPADGTIAYAESRGLTPRLFDGCCSMTWADFAEDPEDLP
ncbi:MAG: radical SAM protein [Actinomycetota bacterium]